MTAAYAPHTAYIAPARRRDEVWRLLAGALVIIAVYVGGLMLLAAFLNQTYGRWIAQAILWKTAQGETPGALLLMLWTFLGLALGPMAAARLIHGRSAATLVGPSFARALHDFGRVTLYLGALQLLILPLTLGADEIRSGLPVRSFLLYLPFAIPALLIQTGAEELVFRGYLQQQLAARFNARVVWMGLPAVLFAWGHFQPAEFGASAWTLALWAGAFGLFAADLTARTGTLGAAIGFHFTNNAGALLLVSLDRNLDGLALWKLSVDIGQPGVLGPALAVDFAMMIVAWLVARLALRV